MRLLSIFKPEFRAKPSLVLKRLAGLCGIKLNEGIVELPWNLPLHVSTNDELGRSVYYSRVYDLCLTEALWRLTKPGDFCVDIGANIGYASSIMSTRAGVTGEVLAIEPHPRVFYRLVQNCSLWSSPTLARLNCLQLGASDYVGKRLLNIPPAFKENQGMAHFYEAGEKPLISDSEIEVECSTLDHILSKINRARVNILKVDAEGHELNVLKGAIGAIRENRIKQIIFEDSRSSWRTPHELSEDYAFLRNEGLTIFRIRRGKGAPILEELEELKTREKDCWTSWEPPNFIATREPSTIRQDFVADGWRSLKNR